MPMDDLDRRHARRQQPQLIIVDTFDLGPKSLAIGDNVRLNITGPCGRCVMITLAQGALPKDSGILRTAVQQSHGHVGVYAAVTRGGTIRRGDPVRLA